MLKWTSMHLKIIPQSSLWFGLQQLQLHELSLLHAQCLRIAQQDFCQKGIFGRSNCKVTFHINILWIHVIFQQKDEEAHSDEEFLDATDTWEVCTVTFPEIGGANFKSALWVFKQQLVQKMRVHCRISIVLPLTSFVRHKCKFLYVNLRLP